MSHLAAARHRAPAHLALSLTIALIALLTATVSARAASPITAFYAGPITPASACAADGTGVVPSTNASTYSDFCIAYATASDVVDNPDAAPAITDDDLKSQVIDTPLGFAAMAGNYPHCTADQFAYASNTVDNCPAAAQIGTASTDIRTQITAPSGSNLDLFVPPVPGKIYNLDHGPDEVARLGITLHPFVIVDQPLVKVIVSVKLRPAPNVGLESVIDNLPTTVEINPPTRTAQQTQPLAVDDFSLILWGSGGHTVNQPAPFAFLGSDCTTDQTTQIAAVSYDGTPTSADAKPYRLTNCDDPAIPFAATSQVTTSDTRPDETTAATVDVRFAQSTDGVHVASPVKSTTLTLPAGLAFSGQIASGADGLPLCTADQFAQTSAAANTCAPATAIGDVTITSPAVDTPLTGHAYLGAQPATHALPDLYIEAQLGSATDAPRVKLLAHLTLDDQDRIVATLTDLPQLPVSELSLSFRGGDHSALVTPPQCGTYAGALVAVPWAAPTTKSSSTSSYALTDACDSLAGFSPSVGFALDDPNTAGKSSPLTSTVSRPDRSPRISHVEINLPQGQLATLKGVPECGASDAAAGTCPESTRVGSITSLAGVGPAPFSAPGTVYLTAPVNGDVAGLAFEVPITFGDVDLGQLNLAARVQIRSNDLGLRVIADVPQRFAGIPLNLQSLAIRLDRPGFALSPTSCGTLQTTSFITADTGAVATENSGMVVGGCDALGFAPQIEGSATGATANNGRPNVSVKITNPADNVALKQAFVLLPKGLSVDLKQVPRACDLAAFQASSCPATAAIGKASGALSITDDPLTGNVYLLKIPGQALPGIGLAFTGRFAGNVQGVTAVDPKTSQLRTNFTAIPDLPLTSLQIDITGGTGGILIATTALCAAPTLGFQGTFVSQAKPFLQRTSYTYCGAPLGTPSPRVAASLKHVSTGKPLIALSVGAPVVDGTQLKLKSLTATPPSGYALVSSKARSTKGVAIKHLTVAGKAPTKGLSKTKLGVTLPSAGTTFAKVFTRTGTITLSSTTRRKSKKAVRMTVAVTYTNGQTVTVPVSLTPR